MGASQVVSTDPSYHPDHSGLALDPADRTLWIINQEYLMQVGRNGIALSPVTYPYPFLYSNPPGGEFNLLPEPSVGVLIGALCVGTPARASSRHLRHIPLCFPRKPLRCKPSVQGRRLVAVLDTPVAFPDGSLHLAGRGGSPALGGSVSFGQ